MGAERSPKPSAMQMAGGFTVAVTRRESIDGHARGLMAAPPLVRRTQGGAAPAMRRDGQWAEGAVGWRCGLRASEVGQAAARGRSRDVTKAHWVPNPYFTRAEERAQELQEELGIRGIRRSVFRCFGVSVCLCFCVFPVFLRR